MKIFFEKYIESLKAKPRQVSGFTLLFTILITSIILAIALGISRISYTELVLSSISREGARAFFASDTGLECGLYFDLENNQFLATQAPFNIDCGGGTQLVSSVPTTFPDSDFSNEKFVFEIEIPNSNSCSRVSIHKNWVIGTLGYTRVESLGYNRNCATVDATLNPNSQSGLSPDPNLVERALRATYENNPVIGGGNGNGNANPLPSNSQNQ